MVAKLTFHPLGAADCTRLDLADARKILVDYADMHDSNDAWDKRVDLPAELRADLRAAKRDYYDVVCFTHLDKDRNVSTTLRQRVLEFRLEGGRFGLAD